MPACLRCRTLVDTNVLPYELCCAVQGRLKAVLLCLRYVDTVAFGAWFVPAWCAQKRSRLKKKAKKAKNFRKVLFPNNYFSRRQLRAEKGREVGRYAGMSSEVGEI